MAELARDEVEMLQQQIEEQGERLKFLLLPKDPLDEKNIMIEVRPPAGGTAQPCAAVGSCHAAWCLTVAAAAVWRHGTMPDWAMATANPCCEACCAGVPLPGLFRQGRRGGSRLLLCLPPPHEAEHA